MLKTEPKRASKWCQNVLKLEQSEIATFGEDPRDRYGNTTKGAGLVGGAGFRYGCG